MITENDLLQAIAECQGERSPNANTCVKLAAFLTIYEHLYGSHESFKAMPEQPSAVSTLSGSRFFDAIAGKPFSDVMPVMGELMDAVSVLNPRLYAATMRRLERK